MSYLYAYYVQILFLSIIVINHLLEIYLSRRQLYILHQCRHEVPSEFRHFLTLADHQKAVRYAQAKLNFGQAQLIWGAVLLFYWFPFRGAEKLYLSLPHWGTHREVLFLCLFALIQILLGLPWAVYSTFALEEKHGFNRTTPKVFVIDRLKGLLLGTVLILPLLYGVLYIYQGVGQWWWLVSFFLVTIFQFLLIWIYPTYIAPLFNKFHPLQMEELKKGIEKLVARAGFRANEVFVMDASKRSSHGNAYFTGLGQNKRVVFFDTLLKDLSNNEVLAILAHELGHLKYKHIIKSLVVSVAFSFIGFWIMGRLASEQWFYAGHYIRVFTPGVLILIFSKAVPLYTFWTTPFSSWISRKREFQADEYAAQEVHPKELINALLKLYKQNASPVITDRLYSGFYYSHPPALERIKHLESLVGQSRERLT